MVENKQRILDLLLKTLQATANAADIASLKTSINEWKFFLNLIISS